jgi:hypothetical protein
MAALYGIPRDLLPSNWAAFASYSAAMQSNILTVSNAAKNIVDMLQKQASYMPAWYWLLSGQLLPPHVSAAFGLERNEASRCAVDRAVGRLKSWYQVLPWRLRRVGPFQEAHARLLGKPRPDLRTQLLMFSGLGGVLYPCQSNGGATRLIAAIHRLRRSLAALPNKGLLVGLGLISAVEVVIKSSADHGKVFVFFQYKRLVTRNEMPIV